MKALFVLTLLLILGKAWSKDSTFEDELQFLEKNAEKVTEETLQAPLFEKEDELTDEIKAKQSSVSKETTTPNNAQELPAKNIRRIRSR